MVGWFEEDKFEERGSVSYAVTINATVRAEFLKELPQMVEAGTLDYACDGTVTFGTGKTPADG
jgi:hypothetical protein